MLTLCRRWFVLAVLVASSSMAGVNPGQSPASTNNDDSCDISTQPAATLLLPYFQVNLDSPQFAPVTTLFTITNVTKLPQIARVTLWTDLGYPVLNFNLFLTGYDVQAINLYDVLARGVIASTSGTSNMTAVGNRSAGNGDNPRFLASAANACAALPGIIPPSLLADIRSALTTTHSSMCPTTKVSELHAYAIGYATIDVVATCGVTFPDDPAYYASELLFDNVLTGDYQHINSDSLTGNYAGGNPLVHIRAVPEGGSAGTYVATNLPYTFYDRFTPRETPRTLDRRQPLPSTFASRFIQGGISGFETQLTIWREGLTGQRAACSDYAKNYTRVENIVRFDEHENLTVFSTDTIDPPLDPRPYLPDSSSVSTSSSYFPPLVSAGGDVAGWLYVNLNNGGSTEYSVTSDGGARDFKSNTSTIVGPRQSQNWMVTSMAAEGRYAVEFDAASLGNGCSPAPTSYWNTELGPSPNHTP